jgi:endonuclease III
VPRSYVREARRRGLGRRRERIVPIIERLAAEHSDAEIALRFRSDLELLVSVMLSAQTTDVNVNKVTPVLFAKYRRPEDYLAVPIEELVRLPGVARKTANVVASELGHAQGIVVDTHVRRLSQRLGLTRKEDPVKIESDLQKVVPRPDWARFPHLLIWHGRRVCDARRPRCEDCVVEDLCPSSRLR